MQASLHATDLLVALLSLQENTKDENERAFLNATIELLTRLMVLRCAPPPDLHADPEQKTPLLKFAQTFIPDIKLNTPKEIGGGIIKLLLTGENECQGSLFFGPIWHSSPEGVARLVSDMEAMPSVAAAASALINKCYFAFLSGRISVRENRATAETACPVARMELGDGSKLVTMNLKSSEKYTYSMLPTTEGIIAMGTESKQNIVLSVHFNTASTQSLDNSLLHVLLRACVLFPQFLSHGMSRKDGSPFVRLTIPPPSS
jgi:hypothetical protein